MIRCNECSVSDCSVYKNTKVAKKCKMFKKLDTLKTPMLLHLLSNERKIKNTFKVLYQFGIKIIEVADYPYFRCRINETS